LTTSKSLAKPYARSLFELSSTKAERDQWKQRLEALATAFADHSVVLAVTRLGSVKAVEWLKSALGAKLDDASYSLLAMLVENDRLSSLADIRDAFSDLLLEQEGVGELYVTSAVALSDKERGSALTMFETLFKKKLVPHYEVDPGIQGGLVGRVGDLVYDGSLKGSLEKMRENLIY
jgi:F-type H+-transporting ATPase subunit delta